MWSSWVKRKGATQVMYIAKLKDDPKRVKKTFSMILKRVFEMLWWRGRKWNHIKNDFWSWSIFLLSKYWLPLLFEETLGTFLFSFSFIYIYASSLEDSGVLMIFEKKLLLQKLLFKWLDMEWHDHDYGYTDGGCIFRNGVMHANMAKPWSWRWGSCEYIDGGRIFWSGGMHTNISRWG
jgi:hypothetical protein